MFVPAHPNVAPVDLDRVHPGYLDQVETILVGFEHELCGYCGGDIEDHLIAPDGILGVAIAYCVVPGVI